MADSSWPTSSCLMFCDVIILLKIYYIFKDKPTKIANGKKM